MKKEVTLKEVAKYAKVSTMTVSRVIHNKNVVSPRLRKRVERAIKELNYIPNEWAQSFRSKNSRVVGLIVRDITNPYYSHFVRVIENEVKKHDLSLLLYDSGEKFELEKEAINLFLRKRVEGIIIVPFEEGIVPTHIENLKTRGIPFVILGKLPSAKTDCVTFQDVKASYLATKYLIELGHKDIVHIRGPHNVVAIKSREEGFRKALEESGIPFRKNCVVEGGSLRKHGYEAVQQLLKKRKPPTAIFTFNDLLAIGAMRALREKGLKIPDDVSIVGFDDIEDSSYTEPPLTTIRQPIDKMAEAAIDLLLDKIQGKRSKKEFGEVSFEPFLIERKSCRRL